MKIGLKVDVDTLRGTQKGVLPLLRLFSAHGIKASFFFSVGPDNMGRNLWRLFNPRFLLKMVRSNAPGLYGWDILFKGTFWPGPLIGRHTWEILKSTHAEGHEVGLHAWDHHAWQTKIGKEGASFAEEQLKAGYEALKEILGFAPICSAAPAWRCDVHVLKAKDSLGFKYNSDCRGTEIFRPRMEGYTAIAPQIPTTLPTYDEIIGQGGVTKKNYNDHLFSLLKPNGLNVLTLHAEAEGIACFDLFSEFLERGRKKEFEFVSLGSVLTGQREIPVRELKKREIPGREGWLALQENEGEMEKN